MIEILHGPIYVHIYIVYARPPLVPRLLYIGPTGRMLVLL